MQIRCKSHGLVDKVLAKRYKDQGLDPDLHVKAQ